ncbi:MAG: DUF1501 domain-containing protein [Chloroflexi bacterium]|nr:DUF1501 domain-containing protein [Chloroflexota bacterium]
MFTRRDFVKHGTAMVALGAAVPGVFSRAALAERLDRPSGMAAGKTLVIVQLAGGNDGLNTVVPYADGAYRDVRRTLGVPEDQVIRLDERVGLHPKLAPLKSLWDSQRMAIVEGVGYPNPNLSHFSSMHIWQTASPDGSQSGGWAGKYLDELERAEHDPFHGFNAGTSLAPEMTSGGTSVPAVGDVADYQLLTEGADPGGGPVRKTALLKLYEAYPKAAPYAALLETTVNDAVTSAAALQQAVAAYKPAVEYPRTPFGSGLQLLAEVIASQNGLRVGHVTLGGFDTHSRQLQSHERLMETLAGGLSVFMQDLEAHGKADDVLVMTWSEFGRRVPENGSQGTDHGTAAPLFVFGKGVRGGLYGAPPSLTNLDNGNPRYTTDFRAVYATVIEKWLATSAAPLLGTSFPLLGFL